MRVRELEAHQRLQQASSTRGWWSSSLDRGGKAGVGSLVFCIWHAVSQERWTFTRLSS